MKKTSILFGASLTTANIIDVLIDHETINEYNIIGILDDNPDLLHTEFSGYNVIGKFSDILKIHKEKTQRANCRSIPKSQIWPTLSPQARQCSMVNRAD